MRLVLSVGDPRIAVLDIRSYGNWGEAHTHPFGVPDIAPEKFRQHVQMHLDVFKQTQLCLSRNAHLGRFGPLKPVFDWAVLEKHIAPRRDGICCNSDGRETAIGFGIAPGVFELFDNYDGVKRRGWWDGQKDKGGMGFTLEECVEVCSRPHRSCAVRTNRRHHSAADPQLERTADGPRPQRLPKSAA